MEQVTTFNTTNCVGAKAAYIQHLLNRGDNKNVAKAKKKDQNSTFNTENYIENKLNLLRFGLSQMVLGNHTLIEYKTGELDLLKLTKSNKIPKEHTLEFNAMIEVGAELGLDVSYSALIENKSALVEFSIKGSFPEDYRDKPMKTTFKALKKPIVDNEDIDIDSNGIELDIKVIEAAIIESANSGGDID
jgi:hypothetical protein